ncbi:MAG TPA: hypothetical protein PKY81_04490 [bacterium]|nr:hypothetical protein [bacterium]
MQTKQNKTKQNKTKQTLIKVISPPLQKIKIIFILLILFNIISCGKNNESPGDSKDSVISRAPQNPYKLLQFINHWSTNTDVLKYSVGLDITQSENIKNYKKGIDGIYGTSDDEYIDSISELDSIPYIGQGSLDRIDSYAINVWNDTISKKIPDYAYALNYLNHRTISLDKIEDIINLVSPSSDSLYIYRAGTDMDMGTIDDNYFSNMYEVQQLKGIGTYSFNQILKTCSGRNIQGVENIYASEIVWGKNEMSETGVLQISGKIELKSGVTRNNIIKNSDITLKFDSEILAFQKFEWGLISIEENKWIVKELSGSNFIVSGASSIIWNNDTQGLIDLTVKFPNTNLPAERENSLNQSWEIRMRIGADPFILFDRIGDDEFWIQSKSSDNKKSWIYKKTGNFPEAFDFDNDGLSDEFELSVNGEPEYYDSDGDGIPDLFEFQYYNTDLSVIDGDRDGLNDFIEVFNTQGFGTSASDSDSDRDGLPDGWETALGYNPLRKDSNYNGIDDNAEDEDNDGRNNMEEYFDITNPFVADAKDSGIPAIIGIAKILPGYGGKINPECLENPYAMNFPNKNQKKLNRAYGDRSYSAPSSPSIGYGGVADFNFLNSISKNLIINIRDLNSNDNPTYTDENFKVKIINAVVLKELEGSMSSALQMKFAIGGINSNTIMRVTDLKSATSNRDPKGADIRMEIQDLEILFIVNPLKIKPRNLGRMPGGMTGDPDFSVVKISTIPFISGLRVKLTSKEIENSGGHNHTGRPTHFQNPVTGFTNDVGVFTTKYYSKEASGEEKITVEFNSSGYKFEEIITVKVDWITENLLPKRSFFKDGSTPQTVGLHSNHFYGTPQTVNLMCDIADSYISVYPNTIFHITDGSLEWGGCNDFTKNWSGPHNGHRTGLNFDVDDRDGISLWGERGRKFSELCRYYKVKSKRHPTNAQPNHWHLDFPE